MKEELHSHDKHKQKDAIKRVGQLGRSLSLYADHPGSIPALVPSN